MVLQRLISISCACVFALGSGAELAAQQRPGPREFTPGAVRQARDLPPGRVRQRLEQLPPRARDRAVGWLKNFHFTEQDLDSLRIDGTGAVFYEDHFQIDQVPQVAQAEPVTMGAAVPISPFPASLVFHSRPGAPNVLYLDFTGENISGTAWNTSLDRTSIPAVPFSTDSDFTTFSDSEQTAIRKVWQRVAEDYAPFNIDVTTERPPAFNTRTAHALITRNTDENGDPNPSSSGGGVAYVNVFGGAAYSSYRPAWIYSNNLGAHEAYIAEAVSHEIGHNLGLSHDGKNGGSDYYSGHGSGDTSWGPIMGSAYNKSVSQWSKGEYYEASNTQDDLATIAGKISYLPDDHGGTLSAPTPLFIQEDGQVQSTTPQTDPANASPENKGVISSMDDLDVFSFVTGTGEVNLTITPWVTPSSSIKGGNVDISVELYDESGTLLMSNNGSSVTYAQINTSLSEGVYYLSIGSVGVGNPMSSSPSGYTAYGSIGQYFISGAVVPSGLVIPSASLAIADIVAPGVSTTQFTVTYSDNTSIDTSTIGNGDLLVTGPNGYQELASFVSVDQSSDGTPRIATYEISPPSSFWTVADNGVYTVELQADAVSDTEGVFVPAGVLGAFQVDVPQLLYAADMSTNPGWTLDPQWEYGTPFYLFGDGPSSGYTGNDVVGYNLTGDYENRLSPAYATTPEIDCSNAFNLTLRFQRWLQLRSGDTAAIQFSTDGVAWTDLWMTTGTVSDGDWQLIEYPLPASVNGSASLQFRWMLSSGPNQTDLGWHLDDVQLTGYLDTTSPSALLAVADLTSPPAGSHTLTVTYSDDSAVSLASLNSADLLVTGPNGYSQPAQFVSASSAADATPLTATYAIPAPGGAWEGADDGTYQIALLAAEVEDVFGNSAGAAALGSFEVFLTPPPNLVVLPAGGLISSGAEGGPFAPSSLVYTLTNAGGMTLDWTAEASASWVTISSLSGTLHAGESAPVTVSLNSDAALLLPGPSQAVVSFHNVSNGAGDTTRSVSLTINAHGHLDVASAGFTAAGTEGGPFSPGNHVYTLSNSGESPLDWTATASVPWLSLSSTSGTLNPSESTTVTASITAAAENLAPGEHTDSILFVNTTTGAGDTARPVTLTVLSHGFLSVTAPADLAASGSFGGPFTPSSITYTLENTGETALEWTAGKTAPWLALSSENGLLSPGETASVTATINSAADDLSPDNYHDSIAFVNVTTGNGNTSRPVSLTVLSQGLLGVAADGDLNSTGTEGGPFSPGSHVYTLTNSGETPLDWTASANVPWLSLSSTSGTLNPSESTTVTASITTAAQNLAPGEHTDSVAFVNVTTGNGDTSRPVTLTVLTQGLLGVVVDGDLNSTGTEGGPFSPGSHVYTLTNSGETPLDWTASANVPWLSLSSASGTLNPSESTTVTASITTAAENLAPGEHTDSILFVNTTTGNGNTSRPVSLTVLGHGFLSVTAPADLTASGSPGGPFTPAGVTYTLANTGETALDWSAGKTAPWLTLSALSGTLAPNDSVTITLSVNESADGLPPGEYNDTLTFTDTTTGTVNERPVSLLVHSHGILALFAPEDLQAAGVVGGPFAPASHTYTLTNAGGSTLEWSSRGSASWLTLSAAEGTLLPGAITNVTVTLNTEADTLESGYYYASVFFQDNTPVEDGASSQAATFSRTVVLNVLEPGTLEVSPLIPFAPGGHVGGPFFPAEQVYTLTNPGETSISWTASSPAEWISLSQSGGTLDPGTTAQVTVSLSPAAAALPAGITQDKILFSNYDSGPGIVLDCSITVYDLPDLEARTTLADGALEIAFVGVPGRSYWIESSTDLQTWSVLGTALAAPDGLVQFTDPDASNQPHRFYRTRLSE